MTTAHTTKEVTCVSYEGWKTCCFRYRAEGYKTKSNDVVHASDGTVVASSSVMVSADGTEEVFIRWSR